MLIDGVGPMPVARATSVAELGEIVRRAGAANEPLFPLGGGTQLGVGNPPARPGRIVDCRALDAVIDYPARDMTITVQAGITIARLQEILAAEKQRLPIDVPHADRATLGGTLAANVSGPRRLGFGTLRDYVIGISAVNDEGQEFKAGGRVVKNVAGYDLCKLLVGSLGTLGFITQVTLKLRPLPESSRLVLLPVAEADLAAALDRLHASRTLPVALELFDASSAQALIERWRAGWRKAPEGLDSMRSPYLLVVGYEGNAETVAWQVRQLSEEWKGAAEATGDESAGAAWAPLIDVPVRDQASCCFKANILPSAVAPLMLELRAAGWSLCAHAGSGIVWGYGPPGLTVQDAATMLTLWRRAAAASQGSVVVTRCPPEWKQTLDVWGPPVDSAWLMREVKRAFDPRGLFNPGRFVV